MTKRWATQMGPLDPSDLYTAWKIVHAAKEDGQEILGFAKCVLHSFLPFAGRQQSEADLAIFWG